MFAEMKMAKIKKRYPSPVRGAPDWREMFLTYVGIMGRPVAEFWQLTVAEYELAVEGFCLLQHIDTTSPATSHELAEMLKRFPDGSDR